MWLFRKVRHLKFFVRCREDSFRQNGPKLDYASCWCKKRDVETSAPCAPAVGDVGVPPQEIARKTAGAKYASLRLLCLRLSWEDLAIMGAGLLGRTDTRALESHQADSLIDVGHLRSDPLIHDRDTGLDVVEAQGVPEFVSA